MAPFLKNKDIKDIDLLVIQELAHNLINRTLYNMSISKFYLAHRGDPEARIYFYINKRINPDN